MIELIEINKLEEMIKYEDPKTSHIHHGGKQWTKGVPIIIITKDDKLISTDYWVYINRHGGELVYDERNNLWTQGTEFYDVGKSRIKKVYVVVKK